MVNDMSHRRVCRIVSELFLILILVTGVSVAGDTGTSNPIKQLSARTKLNQISASIHAIVDDGRLRDQRRTDFAGLRAPIREFYRQSNFTPVWIRDGKPTLQAGKMIAILQQAENDGLTAEDYDASLWAERLASLRNRDTPSEEADFDVALTFFTMRYVSDIRAGRINPEYFNFPLDVDTRKLDLPRFIKELLADEGDLKSKIASIEPPLAGYKKLRAALPRYIQIARADTGEKLPALQHGLYLFEGSEYEGVPRLSRLLRLLGDLPDSAVIPENFHVYSAPLIQAVKRFQKRHGLPASGYLDQETIDQLNVPLSERVAQMCLALKRYRWLRYEFSQPPVIINIPEFRLYALNDKGDIGLTMTVDVGQDFKRTRTPVLESNIEYVVFRPYWDVPFDIQRKEIVPEIENDPNYLSENHFEAVDANGRVVSNIRGKGEVLEQIRRGELRIRQKPGADNSLGLIKFVFPNRHSVYLHGVPEWEDYFSEPDRDISHGCIHLKEPAKLAAWMLRDKPEWTIEKAKHAMTDGPDDFRVNLTKPLPVVIIYMTAAVRENGEINFYPDIYGYDADLLAALAKGHPSP